MAHDTKSVIPHQATCGDRREQNWQLTSHVVCQCVPCGGTCSRAREECSGRVR
jgi:hypothetical protein